MAEERSLRILFVCTANICRSPLASALMTHHAKVRGLDIRSLSAAVDTVDRTIHPLVVEILAERGLAPRATKSRPLSHRLVDGADLVLTMTGAHAIAVAARHRDSTTKVFMLDHFVQVMRPRAADEAVDEWLTDLRSHPRSYPEQPGAHDIADPVNQDEQTFRAIADQIDRLTKSLVLGLSVRR